MSNDFKKMGFISAILNFFLLPPLFAQNINPNCNYFQKLETGQTYYIFNKEYPKSYPNNTVCLWESIGDNGINLLLQCEDINMPFTSNCQGDKLAISLSGASNLNDAHNYCGQGKLRLVSEQNKLSIGLFSTNNSPGGRFLCNITAINTEPACKCGWKQPTRIIGGQETGVNEYPSMAALLDPKSKDLLCGASIISNFYALTAAHCLLHRQPGDLGLLVGDHNVSSGADTPYSALYRLSALVPHPQYDQKNQINDIAVVRTTLQITFSLSVGPICLPFKYITYNFDQATVTALGWGFLDFSGPKSDVLEGVNLGVVDNRQCAARLPENIITYSQICTYAPGKDSCMSDSGGPIIWQDPSTHRLQLVGIISYGVGCATSRPAVNTRVTSFLEWIESVITDATYCIN